MIGLKSRVDVVSVLTYPNQPIQPAEARGLESWLVPLRIGTNVQLTF